MPSKTLKMTQYSTWTMDYSWDTSGTTGVFEVTGITYKNTRSSGTTEAAKVEFWVSHDKLDTSAYVVGKNTEVPKGTKTKSFSIASPASKTYTKATASKTVEVWFGYDFDTASDTWGTSSTLTLTLPALASYKVTYNANGGSGAPSAQTKWQGKALALSSTKPTRSGYSFLGWSTSATATSANASYAPGKSYTSDSALALYAVWKPSVSISSLKVQRVDSSGNPSDDGTSVKLTAAWSATLSSTASYTVSYGSATKGALSNASGSGSKTSVATITGIPATSAATITFTVSTAASSASGSSHAAASASKAAVVTKAQFTVDFKSGGTGVGLLSPASRAGWVDIGGNVGIASASLQSAVGAGVPSSTAGNTASCEIRRYDAGGALVAYSDVVKTPEDDLYLSNHINRVVNGTAIAHGVYLHVNKSGQRTVSFNDAAAWRSGLGLGTLAQKSSVAFGVTDDSVTSGKQTIAANGNLSITTTHSTPSGYVGTSTGIMTVNTNHNSYCVLNAFGSSYAKVKSNNAAQMTDLTLTHSIRYAKVTVS